MSVWVVVGGQFGSEGKGKVAAILTMREGIDICVRCGGPNSGHSFVLDDGRSVVVRQIPTGFIRSQSRLLIPAGGLVDLDVLKQEIDLLGLAPERLGIDRSAMVITGLDKDLERSLRLNEQLSSTLCGVGAAVSRRALRSGSPQLMKDVASSRLAPWLAPFLTDTAGEVHRGLRKGRSVLVEGTQGFGLSLFHSSFYPRTTSRDTTAAAFISEVGVSPIDVKHVVLVLRTFPIRVAGSQAGPLENEISWDDITRESESPLPIQEVTTVTKRIRRVGRFDWALASKAVAYNRPTQIAINCLDHLSYVNRSVRLRRDLEQRAKAFIANIEDRLETPVGICGTGPSILDVAASEQDQSVSLAS